ncbi:hypothetical protein IFR05_014380 [Cadophora sp. M221]|nr:hypothetical protein IFR05_014380 [Cadophora sp. M221]
MYQSQSYNGFYTQVEDSSEYTSLVPAIPRPSLARGTLASGVTQRAIKFPTNLGNCTA